MKIELDINNKIILIKENISLKELWTYTVLHPDLKDYNLISNIEYIPNYDYQINNVVSTKQNIEMNIGHA